MKNCIITPTFMPHFQYIIKYLKSADKYIEDKENIDFYFTISAKEKYEFKRIIEPYNKSLNIHILLFEEILEKFGVNEKPDQLLKKYGKFSFQTLKKFYTMLYIKADRYLVLDSETMWIRKTNMKKIFDDFFDKPYIVGSIIDKYTQSSFNEYVIDNVEFLLKFKSNLWFLEQFAWFYDEKILRDLFEEIGSPIEAIDKVYNKIKKVGNEKGIGVFEIILYCNYIYKNKEKYQYKVINANDECEKYLGHVKFEEYMYEYFKIYDGNCGLIERMMVLLTKNNVHDFEKMFVENNFNIIRCDRALKRYTLQKEFIKKAKPYIFAASQDHLFGVNNNIGYIMEYYLKAIIEKIAIYLYRFPFVSAYKNKKDMYERVKYLDYHVYQIEQYIEKREQKSKL